MNPLDKFYKVQSAVCENFNILPEMMYSSDRRPEMCLARQILTYIARREIRMQYCIIGKYLRRNYATCIHNYNVAKDRLSVNDHDIVERMLEIYHNVNFLDDMIHITITGKAVKGGVPAMWKVETSKCEYMQQGFVDFLSAKQAVHFGLKPKDFNITIEESIR